MKERDARLHDFFAGYFNQDWDLDGASSWRDVMDAYFTENSQADVAQITNDISLWVSEGNQQLPVSFGCDFSPQAVSMDDRSWMFALFEYLNTKLREAGGSGSGGSGSIL